MDENTGTDSGRFSEGGERNVTRSWWFPLNSRKAHYFDDDFDNGTISLCKRWMKLGNAPLEDDNHKSADNCKECMKLREKRDGAK